jgi:hypothetical protein
VLAYGVSQLGTVMSGLAIPWLVTGTAMFLTTLAPFVFPSWRGMNRQPQPLPSGEPEAVAQ